MTDDELRAICKQAGLLPEEISMHPKHGIMINASGLQKLCRMASPSYERAQLTETAAQAIRRQMKPVSKRAE